MKSFELCGSELKVLLCAVAVTALLAITVRMVRWVLWEPELQVNAAGEMLSMPPRRDVNDVPEHELMLLPGIGEGTARAIVRYRQEHGRFRTLEDLKKVRGIGPKTLEGLRPLLMCAPPPGEQ